MLEIGCGDGRNFSLYPAGVAEVVAIEPEAHLRTLARRAAAGATVAVSVVDATAEALPVAPASCGAVVASLVLCSVEDQAVALREIVRVLRPGGELRFFEHVVARHETAAALQRSLDRSAIWPLLAGGCHLARDTVAAITRGGLVVERVRRFPSGPGPTGIPFVLGVARLPTATGRDL